MDRNALLKGFGNRLKLITARHHPSKDFFLPPERARCLIHRSLESAFPLILYKYRSARDESSFHRTLSDIENRRLFLSLPLQPYFNDPFDTDPFVDLAAFREGIDKLITREGMVETSRMLSRFFPEDDAEQYMKIIEGSIADIDTWKRLMASDLTSKSQEFVNSFRRHVKIGCLTEDAVSTTMWANYADNGNGIVVAYEFSNLHELKTTPVEIANAHVTICPVLYEDSKWDLGKLVAVPFGSNSMLPYWTEGTYLAYINTAVRKESRWSYEQEWRIIALVPEGSPDPLYVEAIPTELYLGYNMKEDGQARKNAISVANRMGIPVYEVLVDHTKRKAALSVKRI